MVRRTDFEVLSETHGASRRLTLIGELDLATVPRVESAVDAALACEVRQLTIDLAKLSFLDSSGVRLLLQLAHSAEHGGWTLALVNLPERLRGIFKLTGVDENLPLVKDDSS
ncbi:MAG: STAS domain-containing protein [Solirubrobacteraceae bacterium]